MLELVENCFQAVVKHRFIVVTQWAERMVIGSIEFHSVNTYRGKVCIKLQVKGGFFSERNDAFVISPNRRT